MRRALSFLLIALGAAPALAQEDDALAFVEVLVAREQLFLHEPLRVRVRFGIERGLLDERLVPLFRRPLDLSVQLQAEWLAALPGALALPPADNGDTTFALEDGVARATRLADRARGDRTFAVFGFERTFLPDRVGTLELPAARLRFAYASRFEQDFTGAPVAVDRLEGGVASEAHTLEVLALPEDERPLDFGGAVGSFILDAGATPTRVAMGESITLTVRLEGEGNLALVQPLELRGFEDFTVLGSRTERGPGTLVTVHDIAPRHGRVREVPALEFTFFDPEPPASYRTLVSRPIALQVTGTAQDEAGSAEELAPDRPDASSDDDGGWALPLGLGALALVAAAFGVRRATRSRDPGDPLGLRAAAAAAAFGGPSERQDTALAAFLAATLDVSPAAVVGPDLEQRLLRAGVSSAEAARAAALLEEASAARYGGGARDDLEPRVRALVADWGAGGLRETASD